MFCDSPLAVVPVLVGPLQVLFTLLPAILLAVLGGLVGALRPRSLLNTARVLWRQKVQVAVCLACLVGLVWGGNWLWGKLRPAATASEGALVDWPMARGGLTRLGASGDAVGPNGGSLNWMWKQGSESFFSSPTLIGNRVYVASATLGAFAQTGQIYCFDADTGAVAWKSAPRGYRATFSSPVISGDYLVCGEGLHTTRDARVICLDLRPGREGQIRWTFATKSHVECTPVIYENRVFVGAGDDGYYCLELEPDENGKARQVWHVPGQQYQDAETSLAVFEGRVYAGLGVGGRALCVLDAADGRELQRLPMPYPVFSPAAIAGGKLYLGMGNGDFANSADKLLAAELERLEKNKASETELTAARTALAPGGEVRCIDLVTLKTDWIFKTADTVLGAVAVAGEQIYFGSRDGHIYCLSRDGKLLGKWNSRGGIVASPAVTKQHVYAVNESGLLYALDRGTLTPVWEFRLGASTSLGGTAPLFISSPAVGRGRVYVGTQYDGLICAGESTPETRTSLWPGHLGGPGVAGNLENSSLQESGEVHWTYPAQPAEQGEPPVQTPVAVHENQLLVPLASRDKPGLICLPIEAQNTPESQVPKTPRAKWHYSTLRGIHLSPAAVGERVFVVDGRSGETGRYLHCVRFDSGEPLWQAGVASQASGVFCVAEDSVCIQSAEGVLANLTLDGALRWTHPIGKLARAPAITPSLVIVAASEPPALIALDRPTGTELWRAPLDGKPVTSPVVRGAAIYVGTSAGIEGRSLVDGKLLSGWTIAGGPVSGELVLARSRIAYVSSQGELVIVRRENGAVVRTVEGIAPGSTPLLARDVLLLAAESQLLRLTLDSSDQEWVDPYSGMAIVTEEEPAEWLDTTEFGRLTSPAVLHESKLYFGSSTRGLVTAGAPQ